MTNDSVLLVGDARDPQIRRVSHALLAEGCRAVVCDTRAFPERMAISLQDGEFFLRGARMRAFRSVYVRGLSCSPLAPENQEDLAARPRGLLAQCDEKAALLTSLLLTLARQGAVLVNSLETNAQHSRKPYQLERLRGAGVPVPRYLATNHVAAVRRFAREVGQVVYKPVGGGATVRMLEPADLTYERLSALALAPVLFEEYLEGVSVRAYVSGGRVVAAAEIHSSELDYRRGEDAVVPTQLTAAERRAALASADACDMAFTGVDLIRGAEGFRVLECNPSPMFAVFERKTGLDVAGPLARLLLGRRR